ncbi:MAG: mandelate racemase/muconate lactonizing enzyme family protein [Anaerolineae bacterium]|nr:mandelate racemase/muconate lactonizing enzyme family protein [Anaerolineae bacterium]
MKVTKAEIVRGKEPIALPEPWLAAWCAPDGEPVTSFPFAFYRLYTDEGIVGIGPHTGANPALAEGMDPTMVGAFWERHMGGRRSGMSGKGAAGIEIALWDIVGKAANLPIYKLLGAHRDRILVYAATSRLLPAEQLVQVVQSAVEAGFKAVKLRLHRPDPGEDLAAVEAVRKAVGEDLLILVDANQNNPSQEYAFWSRRTALQMARALDALGVYFLEEPLPRSDVEGLAEIAAAVDMFIAGGEHTPTVYDWREQILAGVYDIVQPDVVLGGNMGITGLRKVATLADFAGRLIVPHVCSGANNGVYLAATLHAMATVENCPMVEYAYDPPILTTATSQSTIATPLLVEADGCVRLPDGPGLGVEIDETKLG